MAGKLYQRQGRSLSVQPVDASVKPVSLEPLTDVVIKSAAKIAEDNYAMGNAIALHDSLKYAYEQAPNSPKQFDELANKTIQSFMDTNKVPSSARNALMAKFITAKQSYASKVETNYLNKQNADQKTNAYALSNIHTDDMLSNLDTLYKSIVNRDDKNAQIALDGYKNAQSNLLKLSELKNGKGDYVFNESERKTAKNTQTGQVEAAKRNIDTLSKEELIKFDEDIFQDKLLFQQKTGCDDKSYDDISNYIKNRRAALGDDEKRVIKNQASFTATRLLSTRDPEQYENLKKSGLVSEDTLKAIDKVYKTAPSQKKVEDAYKLEKSLQMLHSAIGDFDPNKDDSTNMQEAIVRFGNAFEQFSNDNGLDQNEQKEVIDLASKYISETQFRDVAKGFFADTAISMRIESNTQTKTTNSALDKTIPGYAIFRTKSDEVTQKFGNKDLAEEYAQRVAHEYTQAWVIASMAGNYETANKILQEGNRAVIIAANSDKIPEGEFVRMEKDLANGKPAYYTMLDGRTVQFMGYSNKDAVFKIKI